MSLISSRLTARRFAVESELPDNFREAYRDRLNEFGFVEPPNVTAEEVLGWTLVNDMMSSSFDDFNNWYVGDWMLFALRIDKRTLPAAKVRAELQVRCKAWAEERGLERVPASIRTEIKEGIVEAWLPRMMPKTAIHEIAWNISTDTLYLSTHAEGISEKVRQRFFRTFGRRLTRQSPLFWIEDGEMVSNLIMTPPTTFHRGTP